ncbi:MAG TPA: ATP-binding protein [Blastocatellia bacterium]|nr:ATP-binding protein [Blastocatellia bacterium]
MATQGCPCGYFNDPTRQCKCSPPQIQRYVSKISGPLLDRIDIHIDVPAVKVSELSSKESTEGSDEIRARVTRARAVQQERFAAERVFSNSQMTPRLIRQHCQLSPQAQQLLERAINKYGLSARAYDRILKVSRTIADLAGSAQVNETHISEAVQYRTLDRNYWQ